MAASWFPTNNSPSTGIFMSNVAVVTGRIINGKYQIGMSTQEPIPLLSTLGVAEHCHTLISLPVDERERGEEVGRKEREREGGKKERERRGREEMGMEERGEEMGRQKTERQREEEERRGGGGAKAKK